MEPRGIMGSSKRTDFSSASTRKNAPFTIQPQWLYNEMGGFNEIRPDLRSSLSRTLPNIFCRKTPSSTQRKIRSPDRKKKIPIRKIELEEDFQVIYGN